MEEARRLLYEKAIKKFAMHEVTAHKTIKDKNLIEMISRYPGHGVGFKVYSKFWPANTFYHIRDVHLFVIIIAPYTLKLRIIYSLEGMAESLVSSMKMVR